MTEIFPPLFWWMFLAWALGCCAGRAHGTAAWWIVIPLGGLIGFLGAHFGTP